MRESKYAVSYQVSAFSPQVYREPATFWAACCSLKAEMRRRRGEYPCARDHMLRRRGHTGLVGFHEGLHWRPVVTAAYSTGTCPSAHQQSTPVTLEFGPRRPTAARP
jgi:hypothetical protein